jgi:hypothetical protein
MRLRMILSDILVGLPAGFLIFMGTILFSTLLARKVDVRAWMIFVALCVTAWIVGLLAGILRKSNGVSTAAAGGLIGALILAVTGTISSPGAETGPIFGPFGWIACIISCILGSFCVHWWRRKA